MASKLSEDSDFKEIRELCAHLTSTLQGGIVNTEFFVEGSRLSDDKIQQGLQLVAQLHQKLESFESKMQRSGLAAELEDDKQTKCPGKANANLRDTIKSIVEQEVGSRLRDLSIENERMKEEIKKSSQKVETLENELKAQKQRLKKNAQEENSVNATEARMKVLERDIKQVQETQVHKRLRFKLA